MPEEVWDREVGADRRQRRAAGEADSTAERTDATVARDTVAGGVFGDEIGRRSDQNG